MTWKKKCRNRKLNKYPCNAYLHEALYFLRKGNINAAYEEICNAIIDSGGDFVNSKETAFLIEIKKKEIAETTVEDARR